MIWIYEPGETEKDDILGMTDAEAERALARELGDPETKPEVKGFAFNKRCWHVRVVDGR
jgi:hypothetical protein